MFQFTPNEIDLLIRLHAANVVRALKCGDMETVRKSANRIEYFEMIRSAMVVEVDEDGDDADVVFREQNANYNRMIGESLSRH